MWHLLNQNMTTMEETHILAEIRALHKEMSANAQRSSDERTEILQKLAKNDADHEHRAEARLQINNAVYGNGTRGLKVLGQELDDRIENL